MTLEPWRNKGTRDPADIIEADQARQSKKRHACFACTKRPLLVGGNGVCKVQGCRPGCGFVQDEKVTG